MKKKKEKTVEQPAPFTPGITRAQVRQHAFELCFVFILGHLHEPPLVVGVSTADVFLPISRF